MKLRLGLVFKLLGALLLLLVIAGFLAPEFTADQYGIRLQASLQRALGRRVKHHAIGLGGESAHVAEQRHDQFDGVLQQGEQVDVTGRARIRGAPRPEDERSLSTEIYYRIDPATQEVILSTKLMEQVRGELKRTRRGGGR